MLTLLLVIEKKTHEKVDNGFKDYFIFHNKISA